MITMDTIDKLMTQLTKGERKGAVPNELSRKLQTLVGERVPQRLLQPTAQSLLETVAYLKSSERLLQPSFWRKKLAEIGFSPRLNNQGIRQVAVGILAKYSDCEFYGIKEVRHEIWPRLLEQSFFAGHQKRDDERLLKRLDKVGYAVEQLYLKNIELDGPLSEEMLKSCPHLKSLKIRGTTNHRSHPTLSFLSHTPQLEKLYLHGISGIHSLSLSNLSKIRKLSLLKSDIESLEAKNELVALKSLNISYCTSLKTMANLKAPNLEILTAISSCLYSLEGTFTALRRVDISQCQHLVKYQLECPKDTLFIVGDRFFQSMKRCAQFMEQHSLRHRELAPNQFAQTPSFQTSPIAIAVNRRKIRARPLSDFKHFSDPGKSPKVSA
ncbi:MAG: hypothetical protein K0S07_1408 [Chlamydiales bacterium]|jgi:hypothetical protein|nr:hypothetical protein [Chlamydiales bacterium]